MIEMEFVAITKCCRAIVMFGPATPESGMRAATYYQVTIDPSMVSPSGGYIRFGSHEGDDMHGWQRTDGLTICEILIDEGITPKSNKLEPLNMLVVK